MKSLLKFSAIALAMTVVACGDSPQSFVELPLRLRGQEVTEHSVSADLAITLNQADVAFGPLYLCAGKQAGQLCDSARLQWLHSSVFDALSPAEQDAGQLQGLSGRVQSWMFDYGFTSVLTQDEPLISSAAQELDNASLLLQGNADSQGLLVPFSASVVVAQGEDAEKGVQVVRKSNSDVFDHNVTGEETALLVELNPADWIGSLKDTDFVQQQPCAPGISITCVGTMEQICNDDGTLKEETDCSNSSQICAPHLGCKDEVHFDADSRTSEIIAQAMQAGVRPTFTWLP